VRQVGWMRVLISCGWLQRLTELLNIRILHHVGRYFKLPGAAGGAPRGSDLECTPPNLRVTLHLRTGFIKKILRTRMWHITYGRNENKLRFLSKLSQQNQSTHARRNPVATAVRKSSFIAQPTHGTERALDQPVRQPT
jgi:hypothetical protein